MYEPLWTTECRYANETYHKLFMKLSNIYSNSKNNIYIIYVSGIIRQDVENLSIYGFETKYKKKIGSFVLYRNIIIYSNKKNPIN